MEPIIILIWGLLVVGVPLALFIASFIAFRGQADRTRIIAGLTLALLAHVLCASFTFQPMFFVLFAGAHTEPLGDVLDTSRELLLLSVEMLYAFAAFSFCTFLGGRSRPWPLKIDLDS